MTLSDILVHIDETPAALARLGYAMEIARQHDAHLTAMYVIDVPMPAVSEFDAAAMAMLVAQQREIAAAEAARAQTWVTETFRREQLRGGWLQVEGRVAQQMMQQARLADIVILSQPDPHDDLLETRELVEAVLFGSGRPLLLVPRADHCLATTERILLGWNGSREAARAVHDALPLLARATSVTVFVSRPHGQRHHDLAVAGIAAHLARHGLAVEVERGDYDDESVGEMLLERATEMGADLIVVGGYGHARLRERLFGGVTRHLLRHMSLPVLFSH